MKKLIAALFALTLALFTLPLPVLAVGSVSYTCTPIGYPVAKAVVLELSWTADASDGSVPSKSIDSAACGVLGWYLYSAETQPGATSPTALYDITVKQDGYDIAGGKLADRSATAVELVNIGTSSFGYPSIRKDLTFALTNNSVNSATGKLILVFVAQ